MLSNSRKQNKRRQSAAAPAGSRNSYCQRPYYEDAKAAHKQVDGYANLDEVGEKIGGKVGDNFQSGIFRNACTIRASYALFNAPEVRDQVRCEIPKLESAEEHRPETVSGDDGAQYIFRVNAMVKFLTEVWGPPDFDGRKLRNEPEEFVKKSGVVIELMPDAAQHGFTGHIQITDGYFQEKGTLFWALPSKEANFVETPRQTSTHTTAAPSQVEESGVAHVVSRVISGLGSLVVSNAAAATLDEEFVPTPPIREASRLSTQDFTELLSAAARIESASAGFQETNREPARSAIFSEQHSVAAAFSSQRTQSLAERIRANDYAARQHEANMQPQETQTAAPNQVYEYCHAILTGVVTGIEEIVDVACHPIDKALYPMSLLAYDAAIIVASHLSNSSEANIDTFHRYLCRNQQCYSDAVARMSDRIEQLKQAGVALHEATGPQKAQMISHMLTTVLVPGYIYRGTVAISRIRNLHEFGQLRTPPKFHHIDSDAPGIGKFKSLTPTDISQISQTQHLYYVITADNELIIAARNYRIGNRSRTFPLCHHELAGLKPVYAAGELTVKNGKITYIDNNSGHYMPTGSHLRPLVERIFNRNGYPLNGEVFKHHVTRNYLGSPIQSTDTFHLTPGAETFLFGLNAHLSPDAVNPGGPTTEVSIIRSAYDLANRDYVRIWITKLERTQDVEVRQQISGHIDNLLLEEFRYGAKQSTQHVRPIIQARRQEALEQQAKRELGQAEMSGNAQQALAAAAKLEASNSQSALNSNQDQPSISTSDLYQQVAAAASVEPVALATQTPQTASQAPSVFNQTAQPVAAVFASQATTPLQARLQANSGDSADDDNIDTVADALRRLQPRTRNKDVQSSTPLAATTPEPPPKGEPQESTAPINGVADALRRLQPQASGGTPQTTAGSASSVYQHIEDATVVQPIPTAPAQPEPGAERPSLFNQKPPSVAGVFPSQTRTTLNNDASGQSERSSNFRSVLQAVRRQQAENPRYFQDIYNKVIPPNLASQVPADARADLQRRLPEIVSEALYKQIQRDANPKSVVADHFANLTSANAAAKLQTSMAVNELLGQELQQDAYSALREKYVHEVAQSAQEMPKKAPTESQSSQPPAKPDAAEPKNQSRAQDKQQSTKPQSAPQGTQQATKPQSAPQGSQQPAKPQASEQKNSGAASYLKEGADIAHAASIIAESFGNKRLSKGFAKISQAAMLATPAVTAIAAGTPVGWGSAALAVAAIPLGFDGLGDLFGMNDDDDGENPFEAVMEMLTAIANSIYEVHRTTIKILNEVKLINLKLDEYHLRVTNRLTGLMLQQDTASEVIIATIRRESRGIKSELAEFKRYLPNIVDQLQLQSTNQVKQYLKVLDLVAGLYAEPDRRLVKQIKRRLATNKSIDGEITAAELKKWTTKLLIACTEETGSSLINGAEQSYHKLTPDVEALPDYWQTFVMPIRQANHEYLQGAAANMIVALGQIAASAQKTKALPHVVNPLLLAERTLTLIQLHRAYWQQPNPSAIEAGVIHEFGQARESLQTLQSFYASINPQELFTSLFRELGNNLGAFRNAADDHVNKFKKRMQTKWNIAYKEFIEEQLLMLKAARAAAPDFAYPISREYFFHKFEPRNFEQNCRNWHRNNWGTSHIYRGALWKVFPSYPMPASKSGPWMRMLHDLGDFHCLGGVQRDERMQVECTNYDGFGSRIDPMQDRWQDLQIESVEWLVDRLMNNQAVPYSRNWLIETITKLRSFDKKAILANIARAHQNYHRKIEERLLALNAHDDYFNDLTWLIFSSARAANISIVPRFASPVSSEYTQKLFIDVNELPCISPYYKALELFGAGKIVVSYEYRILNKGDEQSEVEFKLNVDFEYNDHRGKIRLNQSSIKQKIATMYSADEAIYQLWKGGTYADGLVIDLTCHEVVHTKPVLATQEHKPILQELNMPVDKTGGYADYAAHMRHIDNECKKEICGEMGTNNSVLRQTMQKVEVTVAMIKLFSALFCKDKLPLLEPLFNQLQESGFREFFAANVPGTSTGNPIRILERLERSDLSALQVPFLASLPREFANYEMRNLLSQLDYIYDATPENNMAAKARNKSDTQTLQRENAGLKEELQAMRTQMQQMGDNMQMMKQLLQQMLASQKPIETSSSHSSLRL